MSKVIVHVVEPFATGINTFLQELVVSMPDFKHTIIHGERKENRELEGIKKEYNGKATFVKWNNAQREISFVKDIRAFFELKKILKRIDFDILHLHSSKAGLLGRLAVFFSRNTKIIYTPNAVSFLRTDISSRKKKIYIWLEKFANKKQATIVSSSKSEDSEFNKIGIKTTIIPNGVYIPKKNSKQLVLNHDFKVVFCATITTQKNPSLFNEIATYFEGNPRIQFIWLGDGEQKNLLTSKNITVTGWKSKEEVHEILASSQLYLSTSLWEGLSLSSIEALGFGLPIVLSSCLGNVDILKSKEDGFLFQTKEEAITYIEQLSSDEILYNEKSKKSLKNYTDNYTNFKCGLKYKELYVSLLKS